jgi:hypothetical protein
LAAASERIQATESRGVASSRRQFLIGEFMKKTKAEIDNTLRLADELLTAALKVVSNQVNRDLHQHINNLADCALIYSKNRYS